MLATYQAVWGVPRLLPLLGANLMERSLFAMVAIYLPAFVMLSFHMTAVGVAPVLALVAIGAITGNVLGGRLGDRFHKPAIFVIAQLISAGLGLALFGAGLPFAPIVALATRSDPLQRGEPTRLPGLRLGAGAQASAGPSSA